jgi:hypothetical protein
MIKAKMNEISKSYSRMNGILMTVKLLGEITPPKVFVQLMTNRGPANSLSQSPCLSYTFLSVPFTSA